MSNGFIKLNRCEKTSWLRSKHPWAFILLFLIAERARREHDSPDDLQIGEAYVGDFAAIGATRKQYRTALKFLEKERFIQTIETQKKKNQWTGTGPALDQNGATKRATKRATNGTIVKLIDTTVCDPNFNIPEIERATKRATDVATVGATEGPPKGHKQESKKERSKETATSAADAAHAAVAAFSSIDPIKAKAMLIETFTTWGIHPAEQKTHFKKGIPKLFLALQFITRPSFTINKTPIAALLWAANTQPWLEEANQPKQLSPREWVEQYFADGQNYNGAKCEINQTGIMFYRGSQKNGGAKFADKTFKANFANVLRDFGIPHPEASKIENINQV